MLRALPLLLACRGPLLVEPAPGGDPPQVQVGDGPAGVTVLLQGMNERRPLRLASGAQSWELRPLGMAVFGLRLSGLEEEAPLSLVDLQGRSAWTGTAAPGSKGVLGFAWVGGPAGGGRLDRLPVAPARVADTEEAGAAAGVRGSIWLLLWAALAIGLGLRSRP